jgi:hypothetical protein
MKRKATASRWRWRDTISSWESSWPLCLAGPEPHQRVDQFVLAKGVHVQRQHAMRIA